MPALWKTRPIGPSRGTDPAPPTAAADRASPGDGAASAAARVDRGVRREAAFLVWLANLAFGALLGSNWLVHLPEVDGLRLHLFAVAALVSTVLTLTLLPGLLCIGAAHVSSRLRLLGVGQAFGWTLFQVLLFADTRVYNMFRYHFNGQVLNLVYTRGSEDSIHLGWQVWTAISAGFVCVGSLQYLLWHRALRRAARRRRENDPGHPLLRPAIVFGAVLLPAVFVEKTIYAQADLSRDREITALAKLFPLYARVPMEDLASRVLGVGVEKPRVVELEGVALDYPLAAPTLPQEGARPNVLVLVVDCLRQDAFSPETMPNVSRWSEGARIFEDHLSGGNSTRYGIFSLIYSLHGSYWFPMLQERRSPVLVDALQEAGYAFGVFGSASMNYPELRDTAWSGIAADVKDEFTAPTAWQRDRQTTEALVDWLDEREVDALAPGGGRRPFFGFVLLDSPHQTYSYPPQNEIFRPSAPDMDYLAMTRNEGPEPRVLEAVQNRYKNAVLHADRLLGAVLARLEQLGMAEETIVVVTGDHGEEFLENGYFGHTSNYTLEQVAVPFVVKGPGFAPGRETRPTSHLDLAPTLLEEMGADPAQRAGWALGESLLDPPAERERVVSGWNELGVHTGDVVVRVPLTVFDFDVEVYDRRWNLILDDTELLHREHDTLVRLGADCNRFLE